MIFLVISIAFSIVIFQRHERTQLNGANNVIEHVKWNLDKNAIQSLKQIKINQACPPGYNKQVLQKWLGAQNKCVCYDDGLVYDKCPEGADR